MWEVNLLIESCYLHPLLYIPDLMYSFVMKAYQAFGEPQLISATPVPSPAHRRAMHSFSSGDIHFGVECQRCI
jgi:hypothetical protein